MNGGYIMKKLSTALAALLILSNGISIMALGPNGLFGNLRQAFDDLRSSVRGATQDVTRAANDAKNTAHNNNPAVISEEMKQEAKDMNTAVHGMVNDTFEITEQYANLFGYKTYNTWLKSLDDLHAQLEQSENEAIDNGVLRTINIRQGAQALEGSLDMQDTQDESLARNRYKQAKRPVAQQRPVVQQRNMRNGRNVRQPQAQVRQPQVRQQKNQPSLQRMQDSIAHFNTAVTNYFNNNRNQKFRNNMVIAADNAHREIDLIRNHIDAQRQKEINTNPVADITYGGSSWRGFMLKSVAVLGGIYFLSHMFSTDTGKDGVNMLGNILSPVKNWMSEQVRDIFTDAAKKSAAGTASNAWNGVKSFFGYSNNTANDGSSSSPTT